MLSTSSAYRHRYIIRSEDHARLAELVRRLEANDEIELVDIIGPSGRPHTVVACMSPELASALEMQFRASCQFTIEPDRPLSLFSD